MSDHIDKNDALNHLDEIDKNSKVNNLDVPNEDTHVNKTIDTRLSMSNIEESPWKSLKLDLLPSKGMFYPDGIELLLKSAKTKEIRHWSTMDEYDPVDVRDKIGFVLNGCTKFKIPGIPVAFNFRDYLEIDRYHILFRIHELTFPNKENKLKAKIKCDNASCNKVNDIHTTSQNLLGFSIPEELLKYYDDSEKCFVIHSEKIGQILKFYMPTIGMQELFRKKKEEDIKNGVQIDDAFYKFGPYLLSNWKNTDLSQISQLKIESNSWSTEKFTIVWKVTELLRDASLNRVIGVCENCKNRLENHIFLGGSFTIKDIFIISARLDELI